MKNIRKKEHKNKKIIIILALVIEGLTADKVDNFLSIDLNLSLIFVTVITYFQCLIKNNNIQAGSKNNIRCHRILYVKDEYSPNFLINKYPTKHIELIGILRVS